MAGVTEVVKHHSELETVASLRDFTEKADSVINEDISNVRESASL